MLRLDLATPSEIEAYYHLLANPDFVAMPATLFAVRGQRPSA
jgi:hypothetical protein